MVKIVADSTCDLSDELIEKYDIQIVPLHIVLGEREYLDGIELSPDEIYLWSDENKITPKTSAIGINEAIEAIKPICNTEDEMIVFCISEKMSATGNIFQMAIEELELENKVTVMDSANLSTGIGLLVLEAAVMAKEGKTRKEICETMELMKSNVRASFVVDTLTYLHRGGRCSSISALAGGMLKIHPKIIVKDGAMEASKKYRGKIDKVILEYVKDMENDLRTANRNRVFITHSGCDKQMVDKVYEYLDGLEYFNEILVTRAGGVVSSHCGPGTLGVLYIAE